MCAIDCLLVGLGWAEPMMQFLLHITCSCIPHAYILSFQNTCYMWIALGLFWLSLFLSLSFHLRYSCLWHLSVSQLRPRTLCILGHCLLLILLLLIFGSVMRVPKKTSRRTFLDELFIRNAKSFWQTSPTLTSPLSFTVGDGSHCVTSQSLVHPCWSRSFIPTCMDSIFQYLSFLLTFEVRAL